MKAESTIYGIILLIALCLGVLMGYKCPKRTDFRPVEQKVDTLYVFDTITCEKPVFVSRKVIDSVLVPVTDTLRMHDTLFVYLEREQVMWQDSLSAVYASGINPQIDSVKHFIKDRYITIETSVPVKVRSRWGVGINAGYGVGKAGLTPYVGVGLSYNLLSW